MTHSTRKITVQDQEYRYALRNRYENGKNFVSLKIFEAQNRDGGCEFRFRTWDDAVAGSPLMVGVDLIRKKDGTTERWNLHHPARVRDLLLYALGQGWHGRHAQIFSDGVAVLNRLGWEAELLKPEFRESETREREVGRLIAATFGSEPDTLERMTFGHRNLVYRADVGGRSFIVRTNSDRSVMRRTADNMTDLRELGIPVPRIVAYDIEGTAYPFSYMILEEIPGRDLRYELPDMTETQMTDVAEKVVSFQRSVRLIPRGEGYGWRAIGEKGLFDSWQQLIALDREDNFRQSGEIVGTELMGKLDRRLELLHPYFAEVEPICFLDDLTIKNVIVEKGDFRGVVDFDVVCYGDPLYFIALTQTAILCDVGEERLFYAEELCRAMELDERQRRIVDVYSALFVGSFLEYGRENGDEAAEQRLLSYMGKWLE
ncbi:phosphotransferase family protein [Saccharibacillus sacchari]|uniref:phosphotransferase family protein n=1 Tax=Saccharibacillus sacchari TaxID=456493 RepID=UPI0004B7AFE9|nr:aminoglycoside phosphotransferase family protein [Saccharibacillus sacchari]